MDYPIPSDLKLVDTTGEGEIDRIYVGDVGGQVWRIDLFPKAEAEADAELAVKKQGRGRTIASISSATSSEQRRFFYKSERYPYQHGDIVMITSGTQPNPLSTSVVDKYYAFYDIGWWQKNANGTLKKDENGQKIPNPTIIANKLVDVDNPGDATDYFEVVPDGYKGWYLTLPNSGEKGTSSVTIAYKSAKPVVFFTTYTPPATASDNCNYQSGKSRLYALDFLNGDAAFDTEETTNEDETIEKTNFIEIATGSIVDASDRSIVLQDGYIAGAKKLNLENDSLILSGYKTVPVDPPKSAGKTYWTQIEE
jgi:type IV pilus assembly protein PilY1